MAEPLAVDPSRLNEAGAKLAGLVFPTAPPPITATGTDAVSAAINATMPNIESLVVDGLPAVKAALTRTASSMSTAADIYTKADQSLGDGLKQAMFGSSDGLTAGASEQTAAVAELMGSPLHEITPHLTGLAGQVSSQVAQVAPQISAHMATMTPRIMATVPQVVRLAPQAAQMAQQAPQIAQTISSSAQGAGQGAAAPAQLADDTKTDDEKTDGEDTQSGDGAQSGGAGAASGAQLVGNVPTQGGAGAAGGTASPSPTPV
jgi:hypothetical protein